MSETTSSAQSEDNNVDDSIVTEFPKPTFKQRLNNLRYIDPKSEAAQNVARKVKLTAGIVTAIAVAGVVASKALKSEEKKDENLD